MESSQERNDFSRKDDIVIEEVRKKLDDHIAEETAFRHTMQADMESIKQLHAEFFISPQEHYDTHKKLDRLLDVYDTAGNAFTKSIIALFVMGILLFAAAGQWWHK